MAEDEDITSLDNEKLSVSEESKWDQAHRAEAVLEHILETDVKKDIGGPEEKRMTVAEAIAARPILDQDTGRNQARVLIVTSDERVLIPDSSVRREYMTLADQLDELHIFCLIPREGNETFERAGDRIWFYQVRAKNWWQLPWHARTAAKDALTWNGIVRPDVIVGVDPFEAGLAARLIAKKFGRPLQLHIYTNPFASDYKEATSDNNWRIRIAKYLLKRAKSVRTSTRLLEQELKTRYKRLKDISVLPRFYNFTELLNAEPAFDLHQKFPDFVFIMLAFGPMTADSYLHGLFTAIHKLLHSPRIGLIVVGDGPARQLFTDKAKLLGIEKSVVFKKEAEDLASYLKTANLLIEMSAGEDGEVRTLQAAAAGLPMVALATDLRRDLFKDGESAFLCEPDDLTCVGQKVSRFINTTVLRQQFSENAKAVAAERLHEDPMAHYQALALTIESVLVNNS